MEMKHTPGPWKSAMKVHVVDVNDTRIADVIDRFDGKDNNFKSSAEANARLIAAAPDLLAALERLSFAAECRDNTMGDACRLIEVKAELASANQQARAAIAKAAGRG